MTYANQLYDVQLSHIKYILRKRYTLKFMKRLASKLSPQMRRWIRKSHPRFYKDKA